VTDGQTESMRYKYRVSDFDER